MKVLFIGSLISGKAIDDIVQNSRVKPSNAPVNFENMLVKGLKENGAEVTVASVPTVSTYPNGSMLAWGGKKEQLDFGQEVRWIPCINLMFLKQVCVRIGTFFSIAGWLFKNRKEKDKAILNYSVYPPYSSVTQWLGRLFHVDTCCVVTDLPEYLYQMGKASGLRKKLNLYYSKKMVKYQGRYDKYVFLTKHMAGRMGLEDKPAILMEGFSDEGMFAGLDDVPKAEKKTVMYAGRLTEDFNIQALVDGFMQTAGDYQLWLFGSGDMVDYIRACEQKDPRITYFGKVERTMLLEHMKKAHLLISVKAPSSDHSNYAFPSKIMEYMTSGTAVASTMVGGIPDEYFDYIVPVEGNSAADIGQVLERTLALSGAELQRMGEKSREYAVREKNYLNQTARILELLTQQRGN